MKQFFAFIVVVIIAIIMSFTQESCDKPILKEPATDVQLAKPHIKFAPAPQSITIAEIDRRLDEKYAT